MFYANELFIFSSLILATTFVLVLVYVTASVLARKHQDDSNAALNTRDVK